MVAFPSVLNMAKCHGDVVGMAASSGAIFYIQGGSNDIMKMKSHEILSSAKRLGPFPEMCAKLVDMCANKDYLFVSNEFGRIFCIEMKREKLLTD